MSISGRLSAILDFRPYYSNETVLYSLNVLGVILKDFSGDLKAAGLFGSLNYLQTLQFFLQDTKQSF